MHQLHPATDGGGWMGDLPAGPHTPEMQALEAEIDRLDARMDELRVVFVQKEREYADEYDNLEAAFGKELEGIRKVDLRSKGDVLGRMDALAEDPAPGRYESSERFEDLWRRKKQQIADEYRLREEDMTREHTSRMDIMQGELRVLEQRRQQRQEEERDRAFGLPFLGVELVEHAAPGARVIKVRGPSRDAGVREGDILLNAQLSKHVRTKKALADVATHARPGHHLAFLIQRDGVEHEIVMAIPFRR